MEISNPICTVPLRNIVYVHNQLVKYGENIYIQGFASDSVLGNGSLDGSQNGSQGDMDSGNEGSAGGDVSSQSSDGSKEMDPVRMIMDQLGNQYIILKVYGKEFIS